MGCFSLKQLWAPWKQLRSVRALQEQACGEGQLLSASAAGVHNGDQPLGDPPEGAFLLTSKKTVLTWSWNTRILGRSSRPGCLLLSKKSLCISGQLGLQL